ncbi:MAG: hypothetical protein KGJ40_10090 [candidate division NC10 bacterium]|nr:hypothetical protein [candidate division NC10 bacterium]
MIEWVMKNREWLFSGIGVAILVGIVSLVCRRFASKPTQRSSPDVAMVAVVPEQPSKKMEPTIVDNYSQKPTPEDIKNELMATPPFQRAAKASSYVGLKVQWTTTFHSCTTHGVGRVMIHMIGSGGIAPWVYFENLKIDKYPQFKIAHTGTRVVFGGTISKVESLGIVVVPDWIRFPETA